VTEYREETADKRIASNMRLLREQRDMSQSALAEAMSERGVQWHQQTVYKIENGTRPLRASELVCLAAILGTSLDRFMLTSAEARETEAVYAAGARLRQRYELAAEAAVELLRGRDATARILQAHAGSKHARVRDACEDVAARMRLYSLDNAVAEGVRRHGEDSTGAEG